MKAKELKNEFGWVLVKMDKAEEEAVRIERERIVLFMRFHAPGWQGGKKVERAILELADHIERMKHHK